VRERKTDLSFERLREFFAYCPRRLGIRNISPRKKKPRKKGANLYIERFDDFLD